MNLSTGYRTRSAREERHHITYCVLCRVMLSLSDAHRPVSLHGKDTNSVWSVAKNPYTAVS